jgi:chromosome partitioning protein
VNIRFHPRVCRDHRFRTRLADRAKSYKKAAKVIVLIRRVQAGQEAGRMTNTIITVATMKGGSGKSTLASCLAVHWQLNGRKPTLIDADPQRSLARLAEREKALGGVPVIEDATDNAWKAAQQAAGGDGPVIIDTPGFRSDATIACLGITDLVLVPVKPSPFDVDRMLDTLNILINGVSGRRPTFRCVLTQTTRDSVIAKHIRTELTEAGFPVLRSELTNRVIYAEAALWGGTPSLIEGSGAAARDIAAVAKEVDRIFEVQRAAVA